ncbi:uncharacterized protein LOC134830243 [Culicoides brevitarsis]|uniref:uncharacterized protein LOC134830243 n=1 Tax=Culicoides brevitarsis TaxID=469753 RepID=UPI00307C0F92
MSPIPKYTDEEFKKAYEMAKKGNSIRQSAFAYGIPVSTLRKALVKGVLPNTDKHALAQQLSVLTPEEEKRLYDWMLKCGERGHPRTSKQILTAAYELSLESPRPNNFPNSKPSKMWLMRFFRRVQERHNMLCLNIMRPSSLVSDYSLQRNHERLEEYLKKNGLDEVLETPERIGSCDDVLINLIAGHRDDKNYGVDVYNSIDVIFTGLANGKMLTSHIIYKEIHFKDLPSKVELSHGASENGFLNAENFLAYLKNVVVRFLEENSIKRPFLLFIDDIGATLDIAVYEFCEEQQIFLVTAYPNDVWVLTPLDCGPIHKIKTMWNTFLYEKRMKSVIPRNFGAIFADFTKDLMNDNTGDVKAALKNGFKDTGIFPWDINCIDMNAMTTFSRTRKENENKQHYGHLETRYVCTPNPIRRRRKKKMTTKCR